MLHYWLVAKFVCLWFVDGQVVCVGVFFFSFGEKQLPAAAVNDTMRARRVDQNSEVAGCETNTII